MTSIGVDGCPGGWFFVELSEDGKWEAGVVRKIAVLTDRIRSADLTLIDIPIGLREDGPRERLCDLEARKQLGKRKSSVFPTPCRPVLSVSQYEAASLLNFRLSGRKLSVQSWHLVRRIREVDEFIRQNRLMARIREAHPEICFWALNQKREMGFTKKSQDGLGERKTLLSRLFHDTDALMADSLRRYPRKILSRDDILDSLVLAVTASLADCLRTLPDKPDVDAHGLPMEIVFAGPF